MMPFAKLPKEVQRAALAVTHIEDVPLDKVREAVARAQRGDFWHHLGSVDDYLSEIRRALRRAELYDRPIGKIVSLDAFRATKAGAR